MESFYRTHAYLVEHTNAPVRRDLMDEIDWSDRLIGIKGTRGVGKTTFLLQYVTFGLFLIFAPSWQILNGITSSTIKETFLSPLCTLWSFHKEFAKNVSSTSCSSTFTG